MHLQYMEKKEMAAKVYLEQLRKSIDAGREAQIKTLRELIGIESVAEYQEGEMPFGEGVQKAFDYMMALGESMGFTTFRAGGYGGHIQMDAEDPEAETLAIICHLDTVPAGDGWSHDPFGCEEEDGFFYGRGVSDDKGPCVAALYAMKAVRDSGVSLKRSVRLILGLDEEGDWKGMEAYRKACDPPDLGFTPDADFPVIRGEKGIMVFDIAKKFSRIGADAGLRLIKLEGGTAVNMVPGRARALLRADNPKLYEKVQLREESWPATDPCRIRTRRTGKSLEVAAVGQPAHGAHPQDGRNAVTALMAFLEDLPLSSEDAAEFIHFYNTCIGSELDGSSLGCRLEDAVSGTTVVNVGLAEINREAARITINVRYPISATAAQIYQGMMPLLEAHGLGIVKGKDEKPICFDEEDPLVKTLMAVYAEHTGDVGSAPIITAGGTYARAFDNVVAFGALFPGDPDLMHQRDERMPVARFFQQTAIYADAIYRLAAREENAS